MRKLMVVFAHPDDEGIISGSLAHYARRDTEVMLVCTTRGEAGEISDPALGTPETLGAVRQRELEKACEIIGIQQLEFLAYRDSGMADTPENEDPRALIQADPAQVTPQIASLMRQFEPDVVVTFEPFGWYGHPDHVVTGQWATAAFHQVRETTVSSDGPAIWQPQRLFHAVMRISEFRDMFLAAIAAGYVEKAPFSDRPLNEKQLAAEAAVTHVLPVPEFYDIKQAAMQAHRTQFGANSPFRNIPRELRLQALGHEYYIQVFPPPPENLTEKPRSDLFAGLS